jgi:hypothetical protein
MQRSQSTADITQYECNENGARNLQVISNLILLIASLILIGAG